MKLVVAIFFLLNSFKLMPPPIAFLFSLFLWRAEDFFNFKVLYPPFPFLKYKFLILACSPSLASLGYFELKIELCLRLPVLLCPFKVFRIWLDLRVKSCSLLEPSLLNWYFEIGMASALMSILPDFSAWVTLLTVSVSSPKLELIPELELMTFSSIFYPVFL